MGVSLSCIIPGVIWSISKSEPSALCSSWNIPVADKLTGTHTHVCGETTVFHATRMVATGTYFQSCSPLWCCTAAELLRNRIDTSEAYHGTTFNLQGKNPHIYLSINEALNRFQRPSSQLFQITLKHISHQCVLITRWYHRAKCFFLWQRAGVAAAFFMLVIHSLYRKALLSRLSPLPVSRRQLCAWGCWA